MLNAAYNYCLPTLLSWSAEKTQNMNLLWWRENVKDCCWSAGLKSLGDTLSTGRPADLYLNFAVPDACRIPPGGSDYILYRETGLKHYGRFGRTTWVWHSWAAAWASGCAKGNEKKCWMNGRCWPRGSSVVMVESRDGRTTAKTKQRKKTRNMLWWLEYMTERQKIVEPVKKKIIRLVQYVSQFCRTGKK